jgi:hypothetical protein
MCIFGIIDFTRAMWEWNAAAKATQAGVRVAVVNDIVSTDMSTFLCPTSIAAGSAAPVGTAGTEPVACTNAGCNGDPTKMETTTGPDGRTPFERIVARMQAVYDRIGPENVVVEYRHIGLGMCRNPIGPDIDPLVTVKLRNMTFDFITPGLTGILQLDIPDFAASLTGEDHRTI